MRKGVVCVDLFCGCGGLTKGLSDAGILVAKGIDTDATAKETYEKNNPGSTFVEEDVRCITADRIMDNIDRSGRSMLLAGCAPCQPFSKHVADSRYDRRKSLIRSIGTLVEKILPEYIMVENVPRFLESPNTHRARFIHILRSRGYHLDEKIVNAVHYGVPQTRRRYILLASINHPIRVPNGTYKGRRFRTVRDTICRFPKIAAGEGLRQIANHTAPKLSKKNMERIEAMSSDGCSIRDLPVRLWPECHRRHDGHTDTYGRMSWDRPAPTLTCRCISVSNGRFGHPEQNRAISVREAAALQTFPDDYVFYSSQTNNAVHIGNAVPVLIAKEIGVEIARGASD